jgi:crossover junction endodeoxyribonuclease RusA
MEREPIRLTVYGDPAPQGSKRIFKGRLVEASSEKLKRWRKSVTDTCLAHMEETGWRPFMGPVQLRITFYMHRGKTVKREMPIVPPDLDKLVRGVGDALTYGEAWGDDSQVVSLVVEKVYADDRPPGAEIEIHSVTI